MAYRFSHVLVSNIAEEQLQTFIDGSVEKFIQTKFSGPANGINIEHIDGKVYSGRINGVDRFFFVFVADGNGQRVPFIFAANSHEYEEIKQSQLYKRYKKELPTAEEIETATSIDFNTEKTVIIPEPQDEEVGVVYFKPKVIFLDEDQSVASQELLRFYNDNQKVFLKAIAGAGKTALALNLLGQIVDQSSDQEDGQPEEIFLYLTKTEELAQEQQKNFAKLHPQQARRVRFLSYHQFLKENADLREDQEIIDDHEIFLEWYDQQRFNKKGDAKLEKKFGKKSYPKIPEQVYNEFCHLAGNYDDEDAYKADHVGRCLYKPANKQTDKERESDLSREDIIKLYAQYQGYLQAYLAQHQSLFDPRKIKFEDIAEEEKYSAIIVDEVQLFDREKLQKIQDFSKKPLQFFGDISQGSATAHQDHLVLDRSTPNLLTLAINYRSSEPVIEFAKLILGQMNRIGNLGGASFEIKSNGSLTEGRVDWNSKVGKEPNIDSDFADIAEDIEQNPDLYLIIVPNVKIQEQLKAKFPDAMVVVASKCHGLEFPKVVLYRCIWEDREFGQLQTTQTSIDGSKPKDKENVENIRKLDQYRTLFGAVTRAIKSIYVINPQTNLTRFFQENSVSTPNSVVTTRSRVVEPEKPQINLKSKIVSLILLAAKMKDGGNAFDNQIDSMVRSVVKLFPNIERSAEEVRKLLINLVEKNYLLLKDNSDLCKAIIDSDEGKIIKQIESYNNFLNGGYLRYELLPEGINPYLKIGDKNILSYVLSTKNPELLKKLLGENKLKGEETKKNIHLLYNSELEVDCFSILLNFVQPVSADDIKRLLEFFSYPEKDENPWIEIINNYWQTKSKPQPQPQVKASTNKQPSLTKKDREGLNKLMNAFRQDNLLLAKSLLDSGIKFDQADEKGLRPLHVAVQYCAHDVVKSLLEKYRPDVNQADKDGLTPLHFAVLRDDFIMAQLLIDNGANVNQVNKAGEAPLYVALTMDKVRMVTLLLDNDADVNQVRESDGLSPLHFATTLKNEMMLILLYNGADVNQARESDGASPLHCAAQIGSALAVETLLEYKANVNQERTSDRSTPLHFAVQRGDVEVIDMLLKRGANVNQVSDNGTPLYVAIHKQEIEVIKTLLEYGANVNQVSNNKTPLHFAVQTNCSEAVETLLQNGAEVVRETQYNSGGKAPKAMIRLVNQYYDLQQQINSYIKKGEFDKLASICNSINYDDLIKPQIDSQLNIIAQDNHIGCALSGLGFYNFLKEKKASYADKDAAQPLIDAMSRLSEIIEKKPLTCIESNGGVSLISRVVGSCVIL